MSAKNAELEADEEMSRCASCGIAENDDIKLRKCTACYLVTYCSVACQKEHRKKHKKECNRRAAELRDELLFKQPESGYYGDCPICLIPLPLDPEKSGMTPCCSKLICYGCDYANQTQHNIEGRREMTCPFCRHSRPETKVEAQKILMKRVEVNDPVALRLIGSQRREEGDFKGSFEYWTRAAELSDVEAHYQLAWSYRDGEGVEKDKKKEVYHLEEAAIGGFPGARHRLGCIEKKNGRYERAARHFIIDANLGFDDSMETVKNMYKDGLVSKDVFASTLRAHHAVVDATKSPQREAAEADVDFSKFLQNCRER